MGNRTAEIREYQRAEALGLRNWDLFLNLGLAQLENGDLGRSDGQSATAVLLGEEHSESHFNLALVDERRGMLADAEHETLASLRLNPGQPDARNLLGVIYAQEGKTVRASLIWRELVREVPDYRAGAHESGDYWAAKARLPLARRRPLSSPPRRPPSKPSKMSANQHLRSCKIQPESETREISGGEYHGRISSN